MSPWDLLFVPAALLFISLLLAIIASVEQRVLSPRSMIVHMARSRRLAPERVEEFVAAQSEKLLEEQQRPPRAVEEEAS